MTAACGGRARARLMLLGSAVSFGLMAVLARLLSRGEGGFSAGQLTVIRFVVGAAVSLVAFRLRPGLYAPAQPAAPLDARRVRRDRRRPLLPRAAADPGGRGGDALQPVPGGRHRDERPRVPASAPPCTSRSRSSSRLRGWSLVLGNGTLRLGLGAGEALARGRGGVRGVLVGHDPGDARDRQRRDDLLLLLPRRAPGRAPVRARRLADRHRSVGARGA